MTLGVYTKTEIDSIYLITYVQIYFILNAKTKIHLGSFIGAIQRPPSTPELAAVLTFLDQKYAERTPELLQRLWTLASPEDIPTLINSAASGAAHLPNAQTPPDL
ncbi:hypothetical protein H1R20_g937, partial [Candolleomyces eurysporus]